METFPQSFPLPDETLSADTATNAVRTQMDSGTVRQRRRFSVDMTQVSVQWTITDLQLAVLVSFHKNRINLGIDWFMMPLPLGGDVQMHQVRFVEGKFSHAYKPVGMWTVTAKLDVYQRLTFSDALLSIYLDYGFTEPEIIALMDSIDHFHTCVHETLPDNLT